MVRLVKWIEHNVISQINFYLFPCAPIPKPKS